MVRVCGQTNVYKLAYALKDHRRVWNAFFDRLFGDGGLRAVESTMFSLLAGFGNFGMVVASYLGAYVLSVLGLSEVGNGPVDDFRCAGLTAWESFGLHVCLYVWIV